MSIDRRMDKDVVPIHTMEYYSVIKRMKCHLQHAATWMDLETVILSEVSQTEKDKYMISLICGLFKKKIVQMHLFTKQK